MNCRINQIKFMEPLEIKTLEIIQQIQILCRQADEQVNLGRYDGDQVQASKEIRELEVLVLNWEAKKYTPVPATESEADALSSAFQKNSKIIADHKKNPELSRWAQLRNRAIRRALNRYRELQRARPGAAK